MPDEAKKEKHEQQNPSTPAQPKSPEELSDNDLGEVAGGLNPQPLPPDRGRLS